MLKTFIRTSRIERYFSSYKALIVTIWNRSVWIETIRDLDLDQNITNVSTERCLMTLRNILNIQYGFLRQVYVSADMLSVPTSLAKFGEISEPLEKSTSLRSFLHLVNETCAKLFHYNLKKQQVMVV
jgi:hypothetical protein